jgi:hypothetical protein
VKLKKFLFGGIPTILECDRNAVKSMVFKDSTENSKSIFGRFICFWEAGFHFWGCFWENTENRKVIL